MEAAAVAAAVMVTTELLMGWEAMPCELSGRDPGFFEAQK